MQVLNVTNKAFENPHIVEPLNAVNILQFTIFIQFEQTEKLESLYEKIT